MDRIDLKVQVATVPLSDIVSKNKNFESTAAIRQRVIDAVQLQIARQNCFNSHLNENQMRSLCKLGAEASKVLTNAIEKFGISMRGVNRMIKVARTIADLNQSADINSSHIATAIALRSM